MKPSQIITFLLALGLAVAAYFAFRGHMNGSDEESVGEQVPSVVTVQTGQVTRATLHGYIEGFGTIETAPPLDGQPPGGTHVSPAIAGVVSAVKVSDGDHVDSGAVLVQLNSSVADVAVDFAQKALSRQEELLRLNNTSQKAVQDAQQQLAAAQAQQALLRIAAPISGVVTHLNVRPGEAVDLNTDVAEIINPDQLVLSAEIPASQADRLSVGQTVEVQAQPPLSAPVSYISPTVNTTNDTVLIRAGLPAGSRFHPGQFLNMRIITAVHTNVLAIPAESVVTDENGQSVISLVSDHEATQLPVKAGLRENGLVEVQAENLKPGDTVVTVGAYGLPDKTEIRIAQ